MASGRDRQGRVESRGRRRAALAPEGERGPEATAAQGQCRGGGLAAEVGSAGWSDGQEPPAGPVPAWRPSRKGSGASVIAVPLPEKSGVVSRSVGHGGLGREPRAAWRSRGVRRNVGPSPGSACSGRPLVVPWPGAAFFKNPMWFRLFFKKKKKKNKTKRRPRREGTRRFPRLRSRAGLWPRCPW